MDLMNFTTTKGLKFFSIAHSNSPVLFSLLHTVEDYSLTKNKISSPMEKNKETATSINTSAEFMPRSRSPSESPLRKLTTGLLKTYQAINQVNFSVLLFFFSKNENVAVYASIPKTFG